MVMSESKRRIYKRDYLDNVIVRIDFDTPLPILSSGPAKSIYSAVKKRFPITEERNIIGKELLIGPDITKERSVESKEWHYYDINREKHLTVSPNIMRIEYSRYEHFEMLLEDFISVSDAIFIAYPKSQVKRLGLRYIDKIDIDEDNPMEWNEYLIPELSTIFSLADIRETVSRAFHVLECNYGEDLLRFQFGMFNPDNPAPIKKKIYTLDYDMYASRLLDKADIVDTLKRYHDKLYRSFEKVITNGLRKRMEPIDE